MDTKEAKAIITVVDALIIETAAVLHHNNPTPALKKFLNDRIDKWIKTNSNCERQGTEAWKIGRDKTIGGSEMGVIEGVNPYQNMFDLILGKLGYIPRGRGLPMQWGKLFEPLIGRYAELHFDTELKAEDLWIRGKFPTQSYSPDGIGVIEIDTKYLHGETDPPTKEYAITLFEFKCPFARHLKADYMPEYYRSQCKAGLETIDIVDVCMYMEAMFRRCKWSDLANNNLYDAALQYREPKMGNPLAGGFIILTFNSFALCNNGKSDESNKKIIKARLAKLHELYAREGFEPAVLKPTTDTIIMENCSINFSQDTPKTTKIAMSFSLAGSTPSSKSSTQSTPSIPNISISSKETFECIMDLFEDKVLLPHYSELFMDAEKLNETKFYELHKMMKKFAESGEIIYGIIPYKLFKSIFIPIKKSESEGFLNKMRPMIDSTMDVILRCVKDRANQFYILSKYFTTVPKLSYEVNGWTEVDIYGAKAEPVMAIDPDADDFDLSNCVRE
jgi:hypothetical protein